MLILQHRSEQFHPFNTARMVARGLEQCDLVPGRKSELARMNLPIQSNAAVLFPSPCARRLDQIPPTDRPSQLVVIDGTWHQAKTLLRDIPTIQNLPRVTLAPSQPGQYRIRLEPNLHSLSTVEATVAALRQLEPQTTGLDRLLTAFEFMVEHQLAHPNAKYDGLTLTERTPFKPNIPHAIIHDLENVVIVYGESSGGEWKIERKTGIQQRRRPVYLVAERLGDGQTISVLLEPGSNGLTDQQLHHLCLSRNDFEDAIAIETFPQLWSGFIRPEDTLAAYNASTLKLLQSLGVLDRHAIVLKSIQLTKGRRNGGLHHVLQEIGIEPETTSLKGRAGRRLAGAVALTRYLRSLGQATP